MVLKKVDDGPEEGLKVLLEKVYVLLKKFEDGFEEG